MRRYSKQPHLWRSSKRLGGLLAALPAGREPESTPVPPHVHKLRQRLSDETVAAVCNDYRNGLSLADLQRIHDRPQLSATAAEGGWRAAPAKSLTNTEVAELVERYEAGLTIREIAAEQGLAKTTVQDALARTGIVMRSAARRKNEPGRCCKCQADLGPLRLVTPPAVTG